MALKIASASAAKRQIGTSLSEINVTPFVDVVLVLLIIFMVTTPMMTSGIGVNLPQAETESAPAEIKSATASRRATFPAMISMPG